MQIEHRDRRQEADYSLLRSIELFDEEIGREQAAESEEAVHRHCSVEDGLKPKVLYPAHYTHKITCNVTKLQISNTKPKNYMAYNSQNRTLNYRKETKR